MAQLDRLQRSFETSRTPNAQTSPTFEQLLLGDPTCRSSSFSPTSGRIHDQDEDNTPHNKKSVLTKVKEKAKKLRHTLSGKKKHGNEIHDDNVMPSWGVSMEDHEEEEEEEKEEDDEDPEYYGAPMYESELAPENYKETARQHPRADPVVPENHSLASCTKTEVEQETDNPTVPNKTVTETVEQEKDNPISPNKTITETVSEKLAPAYAAVSDATHTIASKIAGLTMTAPEEQETKIQTQLTAAPSALGGGGNISGPADDGPQSLERCSEIRERPMSSPQKWDKGVSVKEYFMQKVEPGEDERALSQVISEAISPRRSPAEMGVVEKVKEAVTSFLRHEEPTYSTPKGTKSLLDVPRSTNTERLPLHANYTTNTNSPSHIPISNSANSSPPIPISTAAHEVVEEKNHGRILQAN